MIIDDFIDQRSTKRHPVRNKSAIMVRPCAVMSFKVLDVSEGGLAFIYKEPKPKGLKGQVTLDYLDEVSSIYGVPIKIVSDTKFPNNTAYAQNYKGTPSRFRRCGVKFTNPILGKILNKTLIEINRDI